MQEIWESIPNYERYEISTLGNVRHVKHQRILKYSYATNGYAQVNLANDKKQGTKCVHHLMANTFMRPRINGEEVHHKDHNKLNCALDNLEILSSHSTHGKLHRKHNYICTHCGCELPRSRRINPNQKTHYCSDECHNKHLFEDRTCRICGSTFQVSKALMKYRANDVRYVNGIGIYCSNKCRYADKNSAFVLQSKFKGMQRIQALNKITTEQSVAI